MNSRMGNNKPKGNIDRKIDSLTESAHELSEIIIRFMEDPEVRNTLEIQHPGITIEGLRTTVKAELEQIEKDAAGNKTERSKKILEFIQELDKIRHDAVLVRFPDTEYSPFTADPNAGNYGMTAKGGARKNKSRGRKNKLKNRKTRRRH